MKGSDTLLIVAQRWAEEFITLHPKVNIQVAGGGTGTGFTALKDKTTDIADASREIKTSEVESCKAAGVNPVEWTVGLDGISIVVHPNNPVTSLSTTQLEMIYNGTYTNWSEVGGNNAPIVTYGRQSTSGTYDFFREHVLHNRDFRADNRELAGNAEIVQSVQGDANGIGYVGVAYTKQGVDVKILGISSTSTTIYQPTIANIKSGAYPIATKTLHLHRQRTIRSARAVRCVHPWTTRARNTRRSRLHFHNKTGKVEFKTLFFIQVTRKST